MPTNNRYPIFIISRGRAPRPLTHRALHAMGLPHAIIVESDEVDAYRAATNSETASIVVLPDSLAGSGCSIPSRNFARQLAEGSLRHWVLDDNLNGFYRYNRNLKTPCVSSAIFRAAEDFVDRFSNVPMSGFEYFSFISRKEPPRHPFRLNTRIYSCILLSTDPRWVWRGRYNEDTDLSLRVLKSGLCTILFQAFLADKETTMTMGGGNTETLYGGSGRLRMAESLVAQHPDVARVGRRFGRYQHRVDYRPFKNNRLQRAPGYSLPESAVDEYGMVYQELVDGAWITRPRRSGAPD